MTLSAQQTRDQIQAWANELGLSEVLFTRPTVGADAELFLAWIEREQHHPLRWMEDHEDMRYTPKRLMPETCTVISIKMHYLPQGVDLIDAIKDKDRAYISRYALGRDYHKYFRKKLAKLAKKINQAYPDSLNRALVDSAPVMEKPLARDAGHGWMGKHTLVLNRDEGSYFVLGEIFTSLDLATEPADIENECGDCVACLKVCPTDAFHGPYDIEVKRCISYLTIENDGPIPIEFREPIGNRIFGCDDCQIICPWNKSPATTSDEAFMPRHSLDTIGLIELFNWDELSFDERTLGSPLRRAGYENLMRNIAVALGNASKSPEALEALENKLMQNVSPMVNEHIEWAIERQRSSKRSKRKIKRSI